MVNNSENLSLIESLGLEEKEAKIYLSLLKYGVLTPLDLSRKTDINRTTLYRVLEKLKVEGFVEEILDQKSTQFQAVSPENLHLILAKKEAQLAELRQRLTQLIPNLLTFKNSSLSPTKVVYFRGKGGLQQLLWNTLGAANSEIVGYGYSDWNEGVGRKFAEQLRWEYVREKIRSFEIQNLGKESKKEFTKIQPYLKEVYHCRYLPKSKLEINHDTYIYNNVFAFYHVYEGELFGIEIHNKEIAKTQKQIFWLLWKLAKKP